jgi:hypothetical protein
MTPEKATALCTRIMSSVLEQLDRRRAAGLPPLSEAEIRKQVLTMARRMGATDQDAAVLMQMAPAAAERVRKASLAAIAAEVEAARRLMEATRASRAL